MKVVIYCRVSTQEQNTDNQKLPLIEYCKRMGWEFEVYEEKESTRNTRPLQVLVYQKLLRKEFDGLVIYKFDRWARSSRELIEHMERLLDKGIIIYSYSENIDLSSSMGRAMLTIISAFAQLERDLIRERTLAGLSRARAWGKKLGRPRKYAENATWNEKLSPKQKAHHEARKRAREAKARKDACENCGSRQNLQGHHPDYKKVDEVITLCEGCHYKAHGKTGAVNPPIPLEEKLI